MDCILEYLKEVNDLAELLFFIFEKIQQLGEVPKSLSEEEEGKEWEKLGNYSLDEIVNQIVRRLICKHCAKR